MVIKLGSCLACAGNRFTPFIKLGEQPLANSYINKPIPRFNLPLYTLTANLCRDCSHSQLTLAVSPEEMFNDDYKYVSGTTVTLKEHFDELVRDCYFAFDNGLHPKNVLDIG